MGDSGLQKRKAGRKHGVEGRRKKRWILGGRGTWDHGGREEQEKMKCRNELERRRGDGERGRAAGSRKEES